MLQQDATEPPACWARSVITALAPQHQHGTFRAPAARNFSAQTGRSGSVVARGNHAESASNPKQQHNGR